MIDGIGFFTVVAEMSIDAVIACSQAGGTFDGRIPAVLEKMIDECESGNREEKIKDCHKDAEICLA